MCQRLVEVIRSTAIKRRPVPGVEETVIMKDKREKLKNRFDEHLAEWIVKIFAYYYRLSMCPTVTDDSQRSPQSTERLETR